MTLNRNNSIAVALGGGLSFNSAPEDNDNG
jgi:hypothetical protein